MVVRSGKRNCADNQVAVNVGEEEIRAAWKVFPYQLLVLSFVVTIKEATE